MTDPIADTRNKIRLKLIPLIEKEINKNFINTITNNSIILFTIKETLMSNIKCNVLLIFDAK